MKHLNAVDPDTVKIMKQAHRANWDLLAELHLRHSSGLLQQTQYDQFRLTAVAMEERSSTSTLPPQPSPSFTNQPHTASKKPTKRRKRNQAASTLTTNDPNVFGHQHVRFGSAGTMLAVSLGEVPVWHRDLGDSMRVPSIVFTTKKAILSIIIECGTKKTLVTVKINPGDVVGFTAQRYLHKLVRDPSDKSDGEFMVFTAWTEEYTEELATEEGALDRILDKIEKEAVDGFIV